MKYYHIHRGIKPSTIENPIEGKPLFFLAKIRFGIMWKNMFQKVMEDT
jgi:hypothetical protein